MAKEQVEFEVVGDFSGLNTEMAGARRETKKLGSSMSDVMGKMSGGKKSVVGATVEAGGAIKGYQEKIEKAATATSGMASVLGGMGSQAGAAFGAVSNLAAAFMAGGGLLAGLAGGAIAAASLASKFSEIQAASAAWNTTLLSMDDDLRNKFHHSITEATSDVNKYREAIENIGKTESQITKARLQNMTTEAEYEKSDLEIQVLARQEQLDEKKEELRRLEAANPSEDLNRLSAQDRGMAGLASIGSQMASKDRQRIQQLKVIIAEEEKNNQAQNEALALAKKRFDAAVERYNAFEEYTEKKNEQDAKDKKAAEEKKKAEEDARAAAQLKLRYLAEQNSLLNMTATMNAKLEGGTDSFEQRRKVADAELFQMLEKIGAMGLIKDQEDDLRILAQQKYYATLDQIDAEEKLMKAKKRNAAEEKAMREEQKRAAAEAQQLAQYTASGINMVTNAGLQAIDAMTKGQEEGAALAAIGVVKGVGSMVSGIGVKMIAEGVAEMWSTKGLSPTAPGQIATGGIIAGAGFGMQATGVVATNLVSMSGQNAGGQDVASGGGSIDRNEVRATSSFGGAEESQTRSMFVFNGVQVGSVPEVARMNQRSARGARRQLIGEQGGRYAA